MKNKLHFLMISIIMLIFSCETDSKIGYSIIPEDDIINLNVTDTFSLRVYTKSIDTLITSTTDKLLLGEYIDPVFGYSGASFVTQYGLAELPDFPSGSIADSIVLSLKYSNDSPNYYGDTTKIHNIKVYRINDALSKDTKYYGNHDPSNFTNDQLVGEQSFLPFPKRDSVLTITLSTSLAEEFLNANSSVYSTTDDFINFFKGLYIESNSENDKGSILKFDIASESVLTLYYHSSSENNLTYKVTSNFTDGVRFNMFKHNYNETSFKDQIDIENETGNSESYIQGMGGLRTKVNFPTILDLNNIENIVIYRAELHIKTAPNSQSFEESQYPALESLMITGNLDNNLEFLIPEYISGSSYTVEPYTDGYYKFDIASYIQDVIDGKKDNNGVYLFPNQGYCDFNRSIIIGNNHSDPMKLIITYGEF